MSAHTLGPWTIECGSVYAAEIVGLSPRGKRLVVCRAAACPERDANALLLRAAPDLLAACESLVAIGKVGIINDMEGFGRAMNAVRAAIQKATTP